MALQLVYETHSISVDNERGIATGWLPGELSAQGRRLARALGERRRNDGLACVFTSDLRRAVETAEIAFAGCEIELRRDRRLRECDYGELNGAPVAELDPRRRFVEEPYPGGESYRDCVQRMRSFLDEVARELDGRRVLVIAHSAQRWALRHLLEGIPLEELVDAPFEWQEGWEYLVPSVPAGRKPGAFVADFEKWDAWRPEEVHRLLAEVSVPWYVAAGWAIDLFLGEQRREHGDLELAVPAARFHEVAAALGALEIFVMGPEPGVATPLEQARDLLEPTHQTWVREPATGLWRFDLFREPSDGGTWVCRRDGRIRLPYDEVIARTADGIPYGRPEIVLLFKAKHAGAKDDGDLAAVLPRLEPERRRWLADALELVHPGHRWLAEVG
jgi:broad specificity phosphatase PhoE